MPLVINFNPWRLNFFFSSVHSIMATHKVHQHASDNSDKISDIFIWPSKYGCFSFDKCQKLINILAGRKTLLHPLKDCFLTRFTSIVEFWFTVPGFFFDEIKIREFLKVIRLL